MDNGAVFPRAEHLQQLFEPRQVELSVHQGIVAAADPGLQRHDCQFESPRSANQPGQLRRRTHCAGQTIDRSEEHTSELQSLAYLVCRLLLEKKKKKQQTIASII